MGSKNKSNRERFEPGDSAFLVSKNWLKAYKKYILYEDVKRNNKPQPPTRNLHPGPISNFADLCEQDPEGRNLVGTGTVEQFPMEVVDRYLRDDVKERYEYKVVNQELWNFIYSRYGGQTIRRIAIPLSQWSTTVEARLKKVPLVILSASRLTAGGEGLVGMEKEYFV
jgi:hypothetical protein